MDSARALLSRLIDYAGLFPPASLQMKDAARHYLDYEAGGFAWMLGRFIVPVSRLPEFEQAFEHRGSLLVRNPQPVRLSALAGSDLPAEMAAIHSFNERFRGCAVIQAVELKAPDARAVGRAASEVPASFERYFEVLYSAGLPETLAAVREAGARAKIRTGGVTPESVPPSSDVAAFLKACSDRNVAFKATAGLHHALPSVYALTGEPGSPRARMHGFLNVFLAAAWIKNGMEEQEAVELLEEGSRDKLVFNGGSVRWGGRELHAGQIAEARRSFAMSFGSCSFEDPISDLKFLGLI